MGIDLYEKPKCLGFTQQMVHKPNNQVPPPILLGKMRKSEP